MIFKILFNAVAITSLIISFYFSFKLMLIAVSLKNRYENVKGKIWNGRVTKKQLLQLKTVADNRAVNDIDWFIRHRRLPIKLVLACVVLLIVIVWFNKTLNG